MLVEFGAGSIKKTRILLDHLQELTCLVPVDISGNFLIAAAEELEQDYHHLSVRPVAADYMYNVLRILRGNGGPLQVSQVRERMLTREPDITRLFDRLVRQELVERSRCEDDRRVVWVDLETKGRELLKTLDRPVMALHRKQLAGLGDRKLRLLRELLLEARDQEA